MISLQDVYDDWSNQVQDPGTISLSEATDILQTYLPDVTDQEGDDWWEAVGGEYGALEITNPGTYVGLRNHANNNELPANDLFDALLPRLNMLAEAFVILEKLRTLNLENEQADIPGNITILEADIAGTTDPQLKDTYQLSIDALVARDLEITSLLT